MIWRSAYARRGRLMLGLLAVTLGVTVSTALATLALQVGDDLARTLRAAGPNFVVLPAGARLPLDLGGANFEPARAGLALSDSTVAAVKRSFWKNNVLEAAPELTVEAMIDRAPVSLIGTWFGHDVPVSDGRWHTGLATLHPQWSVVGRWPREDRAEIVLGQRLAETLGFGAGQTVKISAGGREEAWLVTGVVTAGPREDGWAWAPLQRVQELASRPHEIDRLWLSALVKPPPRRSPPNPGQDPKGYERYMCTAYPANLARDLGSNMSGAEVVPMTEVLAGEGMVVQRLNLLMLLLALASLAASTLGLLSTSAATVIERSIELGLLRAVGASSRQIATLLLGETALVSLAGGLIGWALGGAGAALIRGQTFGTAGSFSSLLLPFALILSLGMTLLGTIGSLRTALRLDPAVVLRG